MQKLLIISYYWPPSGGAGVQRWLKLSKYLRKLDIEVHVLTVDPGYASYLQTDDSLLGEIAPGIVVHTTKSFEPINIYAKIVGKNKVPTAGFSNVNTRSLSLRVVNFIRSNLFIPDPRKGWVKFALKKAIEIIDEYNITKVITSSPPHSTQLIGLKIKQLRSVEWTADFRDPWTDIYYYKLLQHSSFSKKKDARLELDVLLNADRIIITNRGVKALFQSKSDKIDSNKFLFLPNGFDPSDFSHLKKQPSNEFRIVYTGTISDQYKPDSFLLALADFIHNSEVTDIRFIIVGKVSTNILNKIEAMKMLPYFEHIDTVPHNQVNQYQLDAEMLLLLIPEVDHAESITPGKLFEYMNTGNKILNLGPLNSDTADIIRDCNSGSTFDRQEIEQIKYYIIQHYLQFKEGKLDSTLHPNINKYNRRHQAEKLVKEIFNSKVKTH